ncbi:MAG: hypothetical protein FWF75_01720 [Propionibacteriaceae bacterium]|nr:hypothetical protein [Propionibacteriaceae bacterium]
MSNDMYPPSQPPYGAPPQQPYPPQPGYVPAGYVPAVPDKPSGGFAVLGFFIPLVGLILWLVWKDQTPLKARSCGKGALIGVIIAYILPIVGTIVLAAALRTIQ